MQAQSLNLLSFYCFFLDFDGFAAEGTSSSIKVYFFLQNHGFLGAENGLDLHFLCSCKTEFHLVLRYRKILDLLKIEFLLSRQKRSEGNRRFRLHPMEVAQCYPPR